MIHGSICVQPYFVLAVADAAGCRFLLGSCSSSASLASASATSSTVVLNVAVAVVCNVSVSVVLLVVVVSFSFAAVELLAPAFVSASGVNVRHILASNVRLRPFAFSAVSPHVRPR